MANIYDPGSISWPTWPASNRLRLRVFEFELDDTFMSGCKADAAMFDGKSLFPKQLSPPPFKRRHIGIVIEDQGVDIVRAGKDARGDSMMLRNGFEENPNKIADGALGRGTTRSLGES